jgi:type III secretory pathway lipoprotein EscJ
MSGMVRATVVEDISEAEEIQEVLHNAGIEASIEQSDEEDVVTVFVSEDDLEEAHEAIEALTEPDELDGDA